ncbi:proline racemase family protein [Haloarchaeobius salinus]|uniref:proline racemase family protein n=1 Tax=Haloarchaeobius salinus TaxID=1198298 RepID=UPI00210A5713|nr:proline racemase family protein [Haloarchaeobius salinus]
MDATALDWTPPDDWRRVETLDAHTGGEPLRIVLDGLPELEGETLLAKRRHMREELDDYRRLLMHEPRGHADMYGAVLTEPTDERADVGVLFTHNEGYSTMCGHGIVALGVAFVEAGPCESGDEIVFETPAGLVTATTEGTVDADGRQRVAQVAFENVPSFAYALDRTVAVPGIGAVGYDVAFGGAFYAYVEAADAGVGLGSGDASALVDAGRRIKQAVADDLAIQHPTEDDLSFLYGTIFVDDAPGSDADSRNVCVFADGEVDRCPTGTGVSGRLALLAAADRLAPGERFTVESIVDSRFTGWYDEETAFEGYDAVVPNVRGSAHITGRNTFVVDPEDPFQSGFFLR